MKLEMVKRILATGLCVTMLVGNNLTIFAEETVSGGDMQTGTEIIEIAEGEDEETTAGETETVDGETDSADAEFSDEEALPEDSELLDGETVSGGDMIEIEEEEVPLADSVIVELEPVILDGVTVTVSGPEAAFAEGTTVSVVELEPTEMIIDAVAAEEQAAVKLCRVFEVKLMCDGKEVEPLNGAEVDVRFDGDLFIADEEGGENISLYQVEGESNLTKVDRNDVKAEE